MALKATILDDDNTPHLLIGLSRENIESIERGEVFVLPPGKNVPLTEESDIVILFEETDDDLVERMKAGIARGAAPAEPKRKRRPYHRRAK
jgi:hypothetical protein